MTEPPKYPRFSIVLTHLNINEDDKTMSFGAQMNLFQKTLKFCMFCQTFHKLHLATILVAAENFTVLTNEKLNGFYLDLMPFVKMYDLLSEKS